MFDTIEETYRKRLKMLTDEYGGQKKLSEVIEKSPAQISQWIKAAPDSKTGKPRSLKSETAREIEKRTNKPIGWFDQPVDSDSSLPFFDNNVNLALKHILRRIPVISWVQAGCWRGIEYYSDDDLEYIEITTDIKDGFGLRVQGDSMMPEFAQGDIIVVAPHAQPENGSYVVVIQDDTNEATFKKLVYDGAKPYFKPLNPQYPMLESNENTRIVGVVKQKIKMY